MTSPTRPAGARPRTAPPPGIGFGQLGRGEKLITTLLCTLWLLTIVGTIWASPRPASVAEAEAAITGNQIATIERIAQPPAGVITQLTTSFPRESDNSDTAGGFLQWSDTRHRSHWISLDEVEQVAAKHADPTIQYGPSSADEELASRDLTYDRFGEHVRGSYTTWEYLPALALGLMEFGLVVAGAARRGTRWFWFWLLLVPGLPLDAGLLAYVWAEILGRGGSGRGRRMSGFDGFLLCLLVNIVVSMALVAGRALI